MQETVCKFKKKKVNFTFSRDERKGKTMHYHMKIPERGNLNCLLCPKQTPYSEGAAMSSDKREAEPWAFKNPDCKQQICYKDPL